MEVKARSEASPDKKGLCSLAPLRVLPDTLAAQYGVDIMTSFFLFFFLAPRHVGSNFPTRDQTHTSALRV